MRTSKILGLALLVILYTVCVLYIYVPSWLPGYKTWVENVPSGGRLHYMAMLGVVVGAIYLIYLLFKFQQNASMIKLNLDKAELEIAPDKGSSVLNQHMDEIVYYFGATNHDLLIIEDLDRFKNPEIFVKLREINTLINNSLQINRKVTFIYALRDDVFVDESRTKFFDFILPVVPVTNAANSGSNLINMFKSLGLPKEVSHNFLNDLSLFITDRRLIQNIFNEFQVYYHQLDNTALQADILLAMIVYKNTLPTDFSDLQSNKGMVYEFFQRKEKINTEMAKEMVAKVSEWEIEVQRIESNHLKSVYELKLIYVASLFNAIYKEKGNEFTGRIDVGNGYLNQVEVLEDAVFNLLRSDTQLRVLIRNGNVHRSGVKFADVEREIDPLESFDARVSKIPIINDTNVLQLKRDIKIARDEIRQIRGQSVKELLARRKLSTFETPINQHKALAYLVGNGYISEDYWLYVSYFEPGQLSENDFQYILAIKNRTSLPPNHKLTRVDQVILRLNDSDCLLPEVLNYDLLNTLLRLKKFHPGKLAGIVGQLGKLSVENWTFVEGFRHNYFDVAQELIAELINIASNFWVVVKKQVFNSFDYYLEAIIIKGEIESVIALNEGNIFAKDIERTPILMENPFDFLFEKVTSIIQRLNIKFQIPPNQELSVKSRVLNFVYDNQQYALNRYMVDFFVINRLGVQDVEKFNEGQLTKILANGNEPISAYVKANLETYIKEVFLQLPAHGDEAQETFLFLLETENLSDEMKSAIIEKVSFQIVDLDTVAAIYFGRLFQNLRVKATWHNLNCYKKHPSTSMMDIIAFVERDKVPEELAMDNIDNYEEDVRVIYNSILIYLLQYANLTADSKVSLLGTTKAPLQFDSFSAMDMSVIDELEKRNLISTNELTLKELMKKNFATFARLLNKESNNTSKLLKTLDLDLQAYQQLLQSFISDIEMTDIIYESMKKETMEKLLQTQYVVPEKILKLDQFKMNFEYLNGLAGKLQNPQPVIGLIAANVDSLTELLVDRFLEPLPELFRKVAKREGKVVPLSEDMVTLLDALKEAKIIVEKYEVKKKEISVTYLKEGALE